MNTPSEEFVGFVNLTSETDAATRRRLDNLPVSADIKALLGKLLDLSAKVGEASLRIGRKVLQFTLEMLRLFPHVGFIVLLTLVISTLVSLVPIVGGLLAAVLTPLGLLLGVTWGAYQDATSPELAARVTRFVDAFQALV